MSEALAVPLNFESLPPRELWLINPLKNPDERIPTPVDERGLVVVDKLIESVLETVDPSYEFNGTLGVHHFMFPESWYPYDKSPAAIANPARFRNLPIHKGLMHKSFENLLHIMTEPPPVVDQEVMRYRIEAWTVAHGLFSMARETIHWGKMAKRRRALIAKNPGIIKEGFNGVDVIGEEIMQEVLEKNFKGIENQFKRQEKIPHEFRLVDMEESPYKLAENLGRVVVRKSLLLVRDTSKAA